MGKLAIMQFILDYIARNPGWKYDILTDAYSRTYLSFEISQLLEPKGADFLDVDEMVVIYINWWHEYFTHLSTEAKTIFAAELEQIGFDIDRAELLSI